MVHQQTVLVSLVLAFFVVGIFSFPMSPKILHVLPQHTESSYQRLSPPVWPFQWNATLIKINPNNNNIWWTKFYYDFVNNVSRFDFMNDYYDTDRKWSLNCSILFADNIIWFVFPSEKTCTLDHKGIGTISPWWLSTAKFMGFEDFRGMYSEHWRLEELAIDYWARAGSQVPLRATNQIQDPGATDFVDVVLGPQDPSLFVLPQYCLIHQGDKGCPPF